MNIITMCRCFGPGVLNQRVNLCCVFPIPDGDAKRHKVLYWFRQWMPYVQSERVFLYSLHRSARSRRLQARRERELVLGLCVKQCGLLKTLLSGSGDSVCEGWFFVRYPVLS